MFTSSVKSSTLALAQTSDGGDGVGGDDGPSGAFAACLVAGGGAGGRFEDGEGLARVAAGEPDDFVDGVVVDAHLV